MTRARALWAAAKMRLLPEHRFSARDNLVICHEHGGAYLVCRIADPMLHDPNHLAILLADALNAQPASTHEPRV